MLLTDPLYGSHTVPPVLTELLRLPALQRLGRIHQGGAVFLLEPRLNHTRLEHSIGVMLLLRRLGGSEAEQIAGLLHDVSHTAFSHVVDYVLGNTAEDYHEQVFEQVIATSGIPAVLARYGYHLDQLLKGPFPLLEQPLPRLCADRLDYTLRDLYYANLVSLDDIHRFLPTLAVTDNRLVVNSVAAANWIQRQYTRLVQDYFYRPDLLLANQQLADLLRHALATGVLTEADFLRDDQQLLDRLQRAGSPFTARLTHIQQRRGLAAFNAVAAADSRKHRHLDPDIVLGTTVQPLSHYVEGSSEAFY